MTEHTLPHSWMSDGRCRFAGCIWSCSKISPNTEPTNSIDSELDNLYNPSINDIMLDERNDEDRPVVYLDSVKKALASKYISRKEIEEAIGEDEPHQFWCDGGGSDTCECGATSYNAFRVQLRAKLLPPRRTE